MTAIAFVAEALGIVGAVVAARADLLGLALVISLATGAVFAWLSRAWSKTLRRGARCVSATTEPDRLIHPPARLRLMTIVSSVDEIEFVTLRERLDLSDSVLSKHLTVLTDAGYVQTRKGSHDGRRTTWVTRRPARDAGHCSGTSRRCGRSSHSSPRTTEGHSREQPLQLRPLGQAVVLDQPAGADVVERRPHPLDRHAGELGPGERGRSRAGAGRRTAVRLVFQSTSR